MGHFGMRILDSVQLLVRALGKKLEDKKKVKKNYTQ